jgi:CRP-like cAMP-binding protein
MRATEALRSVPLFSGLGEHDLALVAGQTEEQHFDPGTAMVTEGEKGGGFYLILKGKAKVYVGDSYIRTMEDGEFFGEMSLLDRSPRSATVVADSRVTALVLASWSFFTILQQHWSVAQKVMEELCKKVRSLEALVD